MDTRVSKQGYRIDSELFQFVETEVLPGLALDSETFWSGAAGILSDFMPQNEALLATRVKLQAQIDAFHLAPANHPLDPLRYQQFLADIGYLVPEPADFQITTKHVDPEVAQVAGPQLVVPLMNARFALNAANARWGSLYDALYGSDVITASTGAPSPGFDPVRGRAVQAYGRDFLDQAVPLVDGSHVDALAYRVEQRQLVVDLTGARTALLREPAHFVGFNGTPEQPSLVLLRQNGLHIEIQIDGQDPIGQTDAAGVKDLVLEAALTTIQDCEDSIAAVDAADKCLVYRNWLGLMKGDLQATLTKGAQTITRALNPDRTYQTPDSGSLTLPGRSLLFIRQVGHLMSSDAVITAQGEPVPEGILDALITSLIALHDLHDLNGPSQKRNSRTGSIYIVKPKMHGPAEVQFTCDLFGRIEGLLGLPADTLKIGIMDEERRTSVNLKACIRVARQRLVFINTGFLDRTGDEIHTSMLAGPMVRKEQMKDEKWILAYEANNVRVGLLAGLAGKAQIGKGMWAIPDAMASMMATKIAHPQAGASCAWVPSPTAATLHAMHYHQVDVVQVQAGLLNQYRHHQEPQVSSTALLADLLTLPLLPDPSRVSADERQAELDNNIQGLLGYVVRWVDQGIGCSKVPDIHDIGRMEDRATLRIASQHICNWLHHGLLSAEQVMASLHRMAAIVDAQNGHDRQYQPMAPNFAGSLAFQAAVDLIFQGQIQPSGYTEPLLHQRRVEVKSQAV
ncbi:malate synthase G [Reinekea sp.]|jgi:malate synthase|uniref:malate synthase G n=1 Tax=Reinekea sp. TaxID=1970455 RepID=UPI002A810C95|nr:malate synthase G [Reinekea sp.]